MTQNINISWLGCSFKVSYLTPLNYKVPCDSECCLLSHSVYYEGLQDKLAQVRDARAALNALREEHREKLRQAAEDADRQRQIQLAQKLEIMRQKKQASCFSFEPVNHVMRESWLWLVTAGVPGDAKTARNPTSAGAGEGETDASGAAETHRSDESTDACVLSALRTGVHCYIHTFDTFSV